MAVEKDLGKVTAYAYAKAAGYTGTEEQFQQVFNEFTENAPGLLDRLDDAVADAEAAQAAAQTAVTNANTAKNAAEVAQAAAQQTAQDMDDSVQQITTNKNDISDLKESISYNLDDYLDHVYVTNESQLWNRFNVVKGEYIQSDGTVVENATWRHITIPVIEGHTYYFAKPDPTTPSGITAGSAGYVALIKTDGTYYDSTPTANQWKNNITIPTGVLSMIVSVPDSRLYGEEYSIIDGISNINNAFNPWQPRYSKTYIDLTKGSDYRISCVGDSITDGVGGNGTSYPSVLAGEDSNLEVFKFGYPSEDSLYISAMCGATGLYVDPFTIPETNALASAPQITIRTANKSTLLLDHISTQNQCIIGGVEGYLIYADGVNKFQRAKPGDSVTFDRPQILLQNYEMRHKEDILILWAGTNDASIPDMNATLFYQIDTIIKNLHHTKYLVLGVMNVEKFTNIDNITIYYRRRYGNHYINIRQYLLDYGLADANITPTSQDETDISNGMVPQSLRPNGDSYHLNAAGYTVVGKYLYNYIKQLGWIN